VFAFADKMVNQNIIEL